MNAVSFTEFWGYSDVYIIIAIIGICTSLFSALFVLMHDEREHYFTMRTKKVWCAVGVLLIAGGLFLSIGKDPVPFKSDRQVVQERVNACLKAGGLPIVTDSGTRSSTHPYYWGCKK